MRANTEQIEPVLISNINSMEEVSSQNAADPAIASYTDFPVRQEEISNSAFASPATSSRTARRQFNRSQETLNDEPGASEVSETSINGNARLPKSVRSKAQTGNVHLNGKSREIDSAHAASGSNRRETASSRQSELDESSSISMPSQHARSYYY